MALIGLFSPHGGPGSCSLILGSPESIPLQYFLWRNTFPKLSAQEVQVGLDWDVVGQSEHRIPLGMGMRSNLPIETEFPTFVLDCYGRLSAMCFSAGVARPGAPGSHLPAGSGSQAGN